MAAFPGLLQVPSRAAVRRLYALLSDLEHFIAPL
jgi:hypothetical protein